MKKLSSCVISFLLLFTAAILLSINIGGKDGESTKSKQSVNDILSDPVITVPTVVTRKIESEKDVLHPRKEVVIKEGSKINKVFIESHPLEEPIIGQTDIFLGDERELQFSLKGYLYDAHSLDLNNDDKEELEIEITTGQLGNTTIYHYQNGRLKPIPTHTKKQESISGVTSYHIPRFKDIDSDGVLEMLSYHTAFPFDEIGWLEVYKFNGLQFMKIDEYEETTQNFYL